MQTYYGLLFSPIYYPAVYRAEDPKLPLQLDRPTITRFYDLTGNTARRSRAEILRLSPSALKSLYNQISLAEVG